MNISKDTWHYRVFQWAKTEKHGFMPYQQGTNLCPYVRTVLIWAPLRFLFTTTWTRLTESLLSILALITFVTYRLRGLHGLKVEATVFLAIFVAAAFIGAIIGAIWLAATVSEYIRKKNLHTPTTIRSFNELLMKYAKSLHNGVCPAITFKQDGEQ